MDGSNPHRISATLYVCAALVVVATITFAVHNGFSQFVATIVAVAQMKIGGPPAGFDFARTGRGAPGQWRRAGAG